MSSTGRSTPSPSNFQLIVNALADYAEQTEIDLAKNPFSEKVKFSNSPEAVLELLQEAFKQYREGNRRLIRCLSQAVEALHALSGILGEAVSLVSPRASPDALREARQQLGSACVAGQCRRGGVEEYKVIPPETHVSGAS
jgi:hypothetical protein